ncbi:hypothetical protein MTP99_001327 [Tenebrio molitor]|nr:hypothetical protein MTP99_001327 [Tenebrio molitor]
MHEVKQFLKVAIPCFFWQCMSGRSSAPPPYGKRTILKPPLSCEQNPRARIRFRTFLEPPLGPKQCINSTLENLNRIFRRLKPPSS